MNKNIHSKNGRLFIVICVHVLFLISVNTFGQNKTDSLFSLQEGKNLYHYRLVEKDTIKIKTDVFSNKPIDKSGEKKDFSFKKGEVYQLLNYENTTDTTRKEWDKDKYWIVFEKDTLRFMINGKSDNDIFDENYKVDNLRDIKKVLFLKDLNAPVKLISKDSTGLILVHGDKILSPVLSDSSTYYDVNGIDSLRVTVPNQLTRIVDLSDLDTLKEGKAGVTTTETDDEKGFLDALIEKVTLANVALGLIVLLIILLIGLGLFSLIAPKKFKRLEQVFSKRDVPEPLKDQTPVPTENIIKAKKTQSDDNIGETKESKIIIDTREVKEIPVQPIKQVEILDVKVTALCNDILICLNTFRTFNQTLKVPQYLVEDYKNIVAKFKSGLNNDIFYAKWLLEKVVDENGLDRTLSKDSFLSLLTKNDEKLHQHLSLYGFLELVSQTLIYLQEIKNLPAFSTEETIENWSYAEKADAEIEQFKKCVDRIGFKINYVEVFSTKDPIGDIEIVAKDQHSLYYKHYISKFKELGLTFPNLPNQNINVMEVLKIGVWSPKNLIEDYRKTIYIEPN